MTAYLHSIETMGLVDGPGIRTIFFLQGCPLRCAYCHNPDSQARFGGRPISVEEVLQTARRYKSYYGDDGGVTFSGGEPLLQGDFVYQAMQALKKEGITTCLDTSGFGDPKSYPKVFPLVDTLLLDVKQFHEPEYSQLVKAPLAVFKDFLNHLESYGFRGKIWIRHVMIPTMTDNKESMEALIETILPILHLVEKIEILPYHTMGVEKYKELGRPYDLEGVPPMDKKRAKELENYAMDLFHQRLKMERIA